MFITLILIVYGCFILYNIYRYYYDTKIIAYLSINNEEDSSIIEDFITKYNNKNVKFIISGSKCLEWLETFGRYNIRNEQKKEFFNYAFYVKKCIKDILGLK